MPVNEAAALITNGFRARLIDLRDTTALATSGLLTNTVDLDQSPGALAASLAAWSSRATRVINAAQEQSGALSVSYLLSYMAASGAEFGVDDLEPEMPAVEPLSVVRSALLWRLGQSAGRARANYTAGAVAQRVARSAVADSATSTLMNGITRSPTITGWRRVTSSACCQRCANAALGGPRKDGQRFRRVHDADRCTQEPIVAGLRERVIRAAPRVVSP